MVSGRHEKLLQPHKLLGVLLVALALRLALDPDYPVPRPLVPADLEAPVRPIARVPELVAPLGPSAREAFEFRWRWSGASVPWRVVVLDDDLAPIVEGVATAEGRLLPDATMRARLPEDAPMHWFVEAELNGRTVRSAVVPFVLVR
jgi:hypothetical protein